VSCAVIIQPILPKSISTAIQQAVGLAFLGSPAYICKPVVSIMAR